MVLTERGKTTGVRANFAFSSDEQRLSDVEVDKSKSFPGRSLKAKGEEFLGLKKLLCCMIMSVVLLDTKSGRLSDKARKDLTHAFSELGLNITA